MKRGADTKKRAMQRQARANAPPVRERVLAEPVTLEKPIYGGSFLARVEGKALFVPLVLPGEQARVRIVEDKRGYAAAEVEEITQAAPERVTPECPHFGACGGCNYQQAAYAAQLGWKQAILRETLGRGGVAAPEAIGVLAAEPWGYRNRIRLAFDSAGRPGYRGRRSHAVTPVTACPIAAPLLVDAAHAAAEVIRATAPTLRPAEITLFCDADESALLASLFVADGARVRLDDVAHALQARVPALQGMELVAEGRTGRPARTVARWGERSLLYTAAGFAYRVDHGAFFQVNRWLVDALVERVTAGRTGALAWDLFAGVGLFARQLAQGFARVVAVESAPTATPALAHNLHGTSGRAVSAPTLEFLRRSRAGERPELIVVDPPRTGLGAEICQRLIETGAPALVYVSCDPATLARDLKLLLAGGYKLEHATLADLFPQTFHLETVVELRRA